jgi:hypothetical protein
VQLLGVKHFVHSLVVTNRRSLWNTSNGATRAPATLSSHHHHYNTCGVGQQGHMVTAQNTMAETLPGMTTSAEAEPLEPWLASSTSLTNYSAAGPAALPEGPHCTFLLVLLYR